MDFVTLGSTGITVNKNGFGALPIQRVSDDESTRLLRKAYDNGITFIDTARGYTTSEGKIALALSDVRDKVVIATKAMASDTKSLNEQLETSLKLLKTDYIDVYQLHNPPFVPKPGDDSGLYDALLDVKKSGKIKHIGITNHKLKLAEEAAESGLYEIIQFPVSYLSTPEELDFVRLCAGKNIGVLAMKAMSGGLITNSAAAYAFLMQFENVLPIWGVQAMKELDEFISYQATPPALNKEIKQAIEHDKAELSGEFCRGCAYCMPCPVDINISISARMSLLMKRAPKSFYFAPDWQESMKRIDNCIECGHCNANCPYGLNPPELMREAWEDYRVLLED